MALTGQLKSVRNCLIGQLCLARDTPLLVPLGARPFIAPLPYNQHRWEFPTKMVGVYSPTLTGVGLSVARSVF